MPILIATKITKHAVNRANILFERNFIFKKLPIWPPINTAINSGQKFKNSLKTISFVNCPPIPKIEFTKMNKDAVLVICFGYPAFIKNKIGLKNIPPPIPTKPDIKPIIDPINIDNTSGIFLTIMSFLLKDLLSISKKNPANIKIKKSKISNKFFSIEIDAPIKAKGMEPIK